MKLGIKRGLLMGLAVAGMFASQAVPATADTGAGAGVVLGNGTISPGLDVLPAPQNFTFTSANITSVGVRVNSAGTPTPHAAETSGCTASGSSGVYSPLDKSQPVPWPGDNLAVGAGLGVWGCGNGPLAGLGGLLHYVRVGPVVAVLLTNGGKPVPLGAGALACLFVPGSPVPPVQTYSLTCGGAVAQAVL